MSRLSLCVAAAAVAAVLACLAAPAAAAAGPPPFTSFQAYFAGDWRVQASSADAASGARQEAEVLGHYSVAQANGSESLVGSSFDNDTATGELSNELAILVEFAEGSADAGTFFTGPDAGDLSPLFDFEFQPLGNGMFVASGAWKASEGATYQFVAASHDRFLITVTGASEDGTLLVFAGSRVPVEVEKTFFQKYGTMVMMAVFFVFNTFKQRAAHQQGAAAAQGAAPVTESEAAAAAGGAAPAEAKKDK